MAGSSLSFEISSAEGVTVKVLITGGYGMLAQDVIRELESRGVEVVAADKDTLDILDLPALSERLQLEKPDALVNCAAWTAVDAAEENEAGAFLINAVATQNLARAVTKVGARLVHISTDYVFDGESETPYQAADPVSPLGAYGRTKAAGEWAARCEAPDTLIVRTAWLYGRGGNCFPKTLARGLEKNGSANVVDDQHGQPTWTGDVARIIADLLETNAPAGIYHATSSGQTTWWGFTRAIAESIGIDPEVVKAVTSEEFVRTAPRPTHSVLGHDSLVEVGIEPIGPWDQRWQIASEEVLAAR